MRLRALVMIGVAGVLGAGLSAWVFLGKKVDRPGPEPGQATAPARNAESVPSVPDARPEGGGGRRGVADCTLKSRFEARSGDLAEWISVPASLRSGFRVYGSGGKAKTMELTGAILAACFQVGPLGGLVRGPLPEPGALLDRARRRRPRHPGCGARSGPGASGPGRPIARSSPSRRMPSRTGSPACTLTLSVGSRIRRRSSGPRWFPASRRSRSTTRPHRPSRWRRTPTRSSAPRSSSASPIGRICLRSRRFCRCSTIARRSPTSRGIVLKTRGLSVDQIQLAKMLAHPRPEIRASSIPIAPRDGRTSTPRSG